MNLKGTAKVLCFLNVTISVDFCVYFLGYGFKMNVWVHICLLLYSVI
jgi:hypothetical protein